jgi:hypothetical protein
VLSANNEVIASMQKPGDGVTATAAKGPALIRVTFTDQVNIKTVTAGDPGTSNPLSYSFLVQTAGAPLTTLAGTIESGGPEVAIFKMPEAASKRAATYKVTLYGEADAQANRPAIESTTGAALDGEPSQLPSGNGIPGGDFVFALRITG